MFIGATVQSIDKDKRVFCVRDVSLKGPDAQTPEPPLAAPATLPLVLKQADRMGVIYNVLSLSIAVK